MRKKKRGAHFTLNRLQQMHKARSMQIHCDEIRHGINNEVIILGITYTWATHTQ